MTPSLQTSASSQTTAPRDKTKLAALCILLLTAAIALCWSHVKLLSQDEIFVLQTDSVSSVHQLIHIQRTFPISLDPLVYHLLVHAATKLLGPTALALRLPSILGFLLMQLCVFLVTRRIAGLRAALVAMAFPALTATLFYAPEARPYGLLLGLYALTFLAWQTATRDMLVTNKAVILSEASRSEAESRDPCISCARPRALWLILLAVTIALTLNTHYFGILLLVPLCLAEIARTLHRRRLDLPVILAILLGIAGIYGILPFQPAASQFRKHYYNAGAITLRAISQAYRSLFVNYTDQTLFVQYIDDVLLVLFALILIGFLARRLRRSATASLPAPEIFLPGPELTFLLALAALPLFGVLLAVFVTHSIEVRYVLSALIAISIFVAIAVEPWLRNRTAWPTILTLLILAIIAGGVLRIRDQQHQTTQELASLILPPALKAQLLTLPDSHLYIQDMGHFETASYYEPDPAVRSRLALLYSSEEELRYDHHDTASLTAEHLRHFTALIIVPYSQLKQQPGPHLLVLYHSGWDWTDQALAADAQTIALGPALNGDAVAVRFPHRNPR